MAQVFVVYFVPIALFVSITWALAPVLHRYVFQQSCVFTQYSSIVFFMIKRRYVTSLSCPRLQTLATA